MRTPGLRSLADLEASRQAERARLIARWCGWDADTLKAELVRRWCADTPLVDAVAMARDEEAAG